MLDDSKNEDLALQIINLVKNSINNQNKTQKQTNLNFKQKLTCSLHKQPSMESRKATKAARGRKSAGEWKKSVTKTVKAGFQFPVGRITRFLKKERHAQRTGSGDPIYLVAVLEYLDAKFSELAGNAGRDNNNSKPNHHGGAGVCDDGSLGGSININNNSRKDHYSGGRNISGGSSSNGDGGSSGGGTCNWFGDDSLNPSFLNLNFQSLDFGPEEIERSQTSTFDCYIENSFKNCKTPLNYDGKANMAHTCSGKQDKSWIFDCGATDTMTYELSDLVSSSKLGKPCIQTANGGIMDVKREGTIEISPTLKLPNCLYVPSLSHKLLSISHVTKELNCTVLMHPTFCILYDIRTG
ncbi:putative transcription factor Hap3/NF-YB family [Helianthus annuus]|nr:putative transcription factor Hap3/NF-YB family [Helianthus annuus]KAJ0633768.1 putative transcription factor Hap3/NF-YB family [Helianthus annuus]